MKNAWLSIVLLLNITIVFAQDEPVKKIRVYLPDFKTYRADCVYAGKAAEINFNSNPQFKLFRTVIRQGYKNKKLNFAGHYCFVWWGCGSPCQQSAIIDLKTGYIYDGLSAGSGYKFKKDSRMVVVNPPPNNNLINDYATATKPEAWIWNEHIKKFIQKKVRFYPALHQGPRGD